jgi:hypothetical protein
MKKREKTKKDRKEEIPMFSVIMHKVILREHNIRNPKVLELELQNSTLSWY